MPQPPTASLPGRAEPDLSQQEGADCIGGSVPDGQARDVLAQAIHLVRQEQFSGPIAHPDHLRAYNEIVPGSAERILAMAERSLEHAQEMQRIALNADVQDMRDGRRFGFAALVILILSALASGFAGNNVLALALLGAGAVGVVGAFIRGRLSEGQGG